MTRRKRTVTNSEIQEASSTAMAIRDAAPGRPTKMVRAVKSPGLAYNGSRQRGVFKASDYNLADVANAIDREPLVRRSNAKLRYLIWKNGYNFVGQNINAVNYIRERFRQIALVSRIPTPQLMRDIGEQLVTYHNAYIAKVRNIKASGGLTRTTFDGKTLEPVAAYYPLCATTMYIDKDIHGNVRRYQQRVPGYEESDWPEFAPDDMVHIFMDRKVGLSTGTPYVIPVLDDIRALRAMEENVERMVHQNAIPLYHYKIGTPDMPADPQEVSDLQYELERMPPHGGIATSERHEIRVIGAEGQAIDVSPYLEYFMKRVRGGLHLSSVDWGEGDSSSRGTSLTMSQDTRDTVEEYQDVIKAFVNVFMIDELLSEGGFSWTEYDVFNRVEIFIPEIDLETRIKRENHAANMYQQHVLTENDARSQIGKDPIKEEERANMFWTLVTKPTLLLRGQVGASGTVSNSDTPTNQYGTQLVRPRVTKEDEDLALELTDAYEDPKLDYIGFPHIRVLVEEQWRIFKREMANEAVVSGAMDEAWTEGIADGFMEGIAGAVSTAATVAYQLGFEQITSPDLKDYQNLDDERIVVIRADLQTAQEQIGLGFMNLARDTIRRLRSPDVTGSPDIQATFDSLNYRVPLNLATGLLRAKNYGRARALQMTGRAELSIPNCPDHGEWALDISSGIDYSMLPPNSTHPNCLCEVN